MTTYYTTKSVRIYPTPEELLHIQKIRRAERWTYNWALSTLMLFPGKSKFDLTGMFTRFKHANPDIKDIVEYAYHQHAIGQAYEAYRRAKKDGGTARFRTYRSSAAVGAHYKPSIGGEDTVTLRGLRNLKTSRLACIGNPVSYTIVDATPETGARGDKRFLLYICCKRQARQKTYRRRAGRSGD